jgi:2-phospho-L-lactate guanylyltransferase
MRVLVPFDAQTPKTRLSSLLDADERSALARAMLRDVLEALAACGSEPTVLATGPVDVDAPVTVDDRPLTPAVNAVLAGADEPTAVVMADLALATPTALEELFEPDAGVVLVPGIGGGTNAILTRHSAFRVDYHGASFRDHREAAAALDAAVAVVDSFRLSLDVDDPDDLVEVLLHSDGRAATWLREAGVELSVADGRVTAARGSPTL